MVDLNKQNKKINKEMNYLGIDENLSDNKREITGKILGVDFGTKNIGLAISDNEQKQAFVYETLKMSGTLFEDIKKICLEEVADKIVVGLPLGMSGEYTDKTNEVIYFVEALEKVSGLIVVTEDERLTSVQADKTDSGHGRDEESARIILQQYLDKKDN